MKIKSTAAAVLMTCLMVSGLVAGVSAPASAAGTTYYRQCRRERQQCGHLQRSALEVPDEGQARPSSSPETPSVSAGATPGPAAS